MHAPTGDPIGANPPLGGPFRPFAPWSPSFGSLGSLQGTMGVLPEPCAHRARTVRPFAYSMSTRSTMPESELPWLVAGLPVHARCAHRARTVRQRPPYVFANTMENEFFFYFFRVVLTMTAKKKARNAATKNISRIMGLGLWDLTCNSALSHVVVHSHTFPNHRRLALNVIWVAGCAQSCSYTQHMLLPCAPPPTAPPPPPPPAPLPAPPFVKPPPSRALASSSAVYCVWTRSGGPHVGHGLQAEGVTRLWINPAISTCRCRMIS